MSHNTKNKNVQRRSALSFAGADDSIDRYIDNIVESNPWKNVEEIEKSDAARIQNVLNEFDDMITQQKISKAGHSATKKKSKQPTEKSPAKSAIMDVETTISEGTSSNMHSNILSSKTQVQTKKKTSKKRESKTEEETSLREPQHSVDGAKAEDQETSNPNVKEITVNESVKKINKKDITNTTDINLLTSTPKKRLFKTIGETAKDKKPAVKEKKQKMTDSKNKSKEYVKREEKKQRKRTLKKNAKEIGNCQGEDKNMPVKEEKVMDIEELKDNLECNKKNRNALKSKVKHKQIERTKVSDTNNHVKIEESKNVLKENVETKLHKDKKICKIKKECAEKYGEYVQHLLKAREQSKERRERRKCENAANAIAKLSRQLSIVKKKMECIKTNLESSESLDFSKYSEESSSSSSPLSLLSHSSDCSCRDCDYYTSNDYTEYTCDSSHSSIYTE
ncbi:uncharacterized protein [Anoplolepis gracilipes]|uniref:uncharacterized protein isoform X2 n=1 Tax=Anoplolepis gracilipes TaxID=354296 RepID=UPI003BA33FFA